MRKPEVLTIKKDGKKIKVLKKQRLHYRNFPNEQSDGLTAQVFYLMKDGKWYHLNELFDQLSQIHLRRLRTPYFGEHKVEKKFVEMNGPTHVYKYRLIVNPKWKKPKKN